MQTLSIVHKFDCDRTCPLHERRDWCRFNPLFKLLGNVAAVNSHTIKVNVEFNDVEILRRVVEKMGGEWLGVKDHKLYDRNVHGQGFRLPNWRFPLVLDQTGALSYDDFNGSWGDVRDLEGLKTGYASERVVKAAEQLGWHATVDGEGQTVVHNPNGGSVTVKADGSLEGAGFVGQACHDPMVQLAQAVGGVTEMSPNHEYYQAEVEAHQEEQDD